MVKRFPLLVLLLAVAALVSHWAGPEWAPGPEQLVVGELPREAQETLKLIERGGPFPHRQDGTVFQNREGLLPDRPRGYYREYTVRTPGARDRGARRIVTGGDPPTVFYYTEDHYRSFRPIQGPR
jgi:guanyl-specific ribonuclease Sa